MADTTESLLKLADLLKEGLITQDEFNQQKAVLLSSGEDTAPKPASNYSISSIEANRFIKDAKQYKEAGFDFSLAKDKLMQGGCPVADAEVIAGEVYGTIKPSASQPKTPMGTMSKIMLFLVGGFVLIMIFGTIAGNSPEAKEKQQMRDSIDLCWKDYERKSFDPSTKLTVASVCELMEDSFKRKFGHNP